MEYFAHILDLAGIYVVLSVSLNLIVGYAGLPAMGHSAFFCVGAYASSIISINFSVSPWLGILFALSVAACFGWLVSLITMRLEGDFFALATFGLAVITHSIVQNAIILTNGPLGIPGIPVFTFFNWPINTSLRFFPLIVISFSLILFIGLRIVRSPFGRILQGIRENEIAILTLGKNTQTYKSSIFVVGSLFAGLAGSLYAHYITYIDPSSFMPMESFSILLMVVFGGLGSLVGSLIGALVLIIFPELLRFIGLPDSIAAPLRQMVYGALLVILMMIRPQGMLGKFKWR